ncbi:hypothetical protein C8F01DRAFT_1086312 [Mycena amicta]|nr:hypothetical protein C8F01DRAFT_1092458 [Mycena amicta]KAJ7057909.1 hypothetical protein C8F01DRAFT_1086312 [Mycena amicta]
MASPAILDFVIRPAHQGLFDAVVANQERRAIELFIYSQETRDVQIMGYPTDTEGEKVLPEDFAAHLEHLNAYIPCHCPEEVDSAVLLSWPDGSVVLVCQGYPQIRCQMFVNLNAVYETAQLLTRYSSHRNPDAAVTLGRLGYQRCVLLTNGGPSESVGGFMLRKYIDFEVTASPAPSEGEDEPPHILTLMSEQERHALEKLFRGHSITPDDVNNLLRQCRSCKQVVLRRLCDEHRCLKRVKLEGSDSDSDSYQDA